MNPVDSRAVVDLLGVLAYAELTAFDRLAEDARLAPTLAGRAALARMAAAEIGHHCRLHERLVGEAISRSQGVLAEHDHLAGLIVEGTGDLAAIGRLIERITAAHTDRMKTLGLNP